MTTEEVRSAVQEKLDEMKHHTFKLTVVGDRIRRDGEWWYIPVDASGTRVPPPDFLYSSYATIEADLLEEKELCVLLVPGHQERQIA